MEANRKDELLKEGVLNEREAAHYLRVSQRTLREIPLYELDVIFFAYDVVPPEQRPKATIRGSIISHPAYVAMYRKVDLSAYKKALRENKRKWKQQEEQEDWPDTIPE